MEDQTLQQIDLQGARQASLKTSTPPDLPGYQLGRRLGEGTFGQVWAGTQNSTGQAVAIKVLQMASRDLDREVERLRQVSQHPYIVTLLDANLAHSPPFLVMPLLTRSLAASVGQTQDHPRLPIEQVVDWLQQAATALQYVHGRGLLHCDLKPANLLIDDNQVLRVADFGQALFQEDSEQRLGTLFYMPAEQALLDQPAVAAVGWDIYALGATFYQLLSGRLPRASSQLQEQLSQLSSSRQALAHYCQTLPAQPLVPLRQLNPKVDFDLAAIVEHCLHNQPEQRYPDMGSLLADLQRRQSLLPLSCRPARPVYVLTRFIQRNRTAAVVTVLATVLLGLAFQRVLQERTRALQQAEVARQQEEKARETSAQFAFLSAGSLEGSEAMVRVAEAVEQSNGRSALPRQVALRLYQQVQPLWLGQTSLNGENQDLQLAEEPHKGAIDLAGNRLLASQINGHGVALLSWKTGAIEWLPPAQEFDGGQLAGDEVAINDGGQIRWSGRPIPDLDADWMRLDPTGDWLAAGEAGDDSEPKQMLHLFRRAGRQHFRLPLPAMGLRQAEFSLDGKLLAHVGLDGQLHVFQLQPPRRLWSRPMDTEQVTFHPDQQSLLLRHRFAVERVDRRSGRSLQRWASEGVTAAMAAHPQRLFYSATSDQGGRLWQHDTSSENRLFPALALSMACDPQRLAVGFSDGTVRVFGGDVHTPEGVMQCQEGVRWVALDGDELLAFAGPDEEPGLGRLWRWKLNSPDRPSLPDPSDVQLLPSGALAWNRSQVTRAPYAGSPLRLQGSVAACRWVESEDTLVVALRDGRVQRLNGRDGREISQVDLAVVPQALRPDGKAALVCDSHGKSWREVDLITGKVLRTHPRSEVVLERPVYSADGKVAMAFRPDGLSCVLLFSRRPVEIATGSPPRQLILSPHGERFWMITWMEPGYASTVFTGPTHGTNDPEDLARLTHSNMTSSVALAPDGQWVVTSSSDCTAALWPARPAPAKAVRPHKLFRHDYPLLSAGFSPDGRWIATQGIHGQVRLWDVDSGLPLGPPLPNTPGVEPTFTGHHQLATLVQRQVRLWDLTPAPAAGAVEQAQKQTGLSLRP